MRYFTAFSIVTILILGGSGVSAAGPDLVVSSLTRTPYTPTVNQSVNFNVFTKNQGDAPAGSSILELQINASNQTRTAGSLGAGLESGFTFSWTPTIAGNYQVRACADSTGVVAESNEGNNCVTQTFSVTGTPTQPQSSVDLKANGSDGPITVPFNSSVTLNWTSQNTSSCSASGDWSGFRATSGSESTGTLTNSRSYTITCDGASDSVVVNVTTQPANLPTVTLTATPTTINRGQSAFLNWTSTNATECFAYGGWNGYVATSGSQSVAPGQTTTYFINCSNQSGAASANVTVSVAGTTAGNPPTVDLDAQPRNIEENESSALIWTSSNADSCFASGGWSGGRTTSGSEIVYPTRLTTYTIVCTNSAGSAIGNVTVFVRRPSEGAPTVSLNANPTRVEPGTPVLLTWTSTNADTCLASGGWSGTKATSGAETVTPYVQTTYTLTCSNDDGIISTGRTVFIGLAAAAPPVVPPAAPAPQGAVVPPAPTPMPVITLTTPTTARPTPTREISAERFSFKNIDVSVAELETPERERPLMAQIFGDGLGRVLGIIFILLLNAALIFFLIWFYRRIKREGRELELAPARYGNLDNLPSELFGPEIT